MSEQCSCCEGHVVEETPRTTFYVRLGIGVVIFVVALIWKLEGILPLLLFGAAYLAIGGDVVWFALRNILRGKLFDENFLMTVASLGAFAIGEYPEAVAVMLFYQVGEWFQESAVRRSRKSITSLMDIRPDFANIVTLNGEAIETEQRVSPMNVTIGDIILVRPGEKVPLDGVVLSGSSELDTKALTGETVPRFVQTGDGVLSGSINLEGVLKVTVTKSYGQSTVAQILELVESAASRKAPTESFITKFSKYYTPGVVLIAALLAFIPPIFVGDFQNWLYRGLLFLVVSCPCALVISIPLGFFGGLGGASKQGILMKGGNFLEALTQVDTVVFDKTGTLTKGIFEVKEVHPLGNFTKEMLMETAAHAEQHVNHPIGQSIVAAYGKPCDPQRITEYKALAGRGICVVMDGHTVLVGNETLMNGIAFPKVAAIGTKVYIAINGVAAGYFVIADTVKDDAAEAMSALRALGVRKTVMLTGDNREVAKAVAQTLGVDEVYSELLPQDKVAQLERLDAQKPPKKTLVFVGDGINDAPVLARADVGVAMGGLGSDAAIEAADVVLMTDQPLKLAKAIEIARKTHRIVWQNIFFALSIKAIVLVMGAFGLASMWEAVFADVGVAILAILNATRAMQAK